MVVARIDRAGRIVGRDQHDGAGPWRDQLGGVLGVGTAPEPGRKSSDTGSTPCMRIHMS